jgi:hypothetical protein
LPHASHADVQVTTKQNILGWVAAGIVLLLGLIGAYSLVLEKEEKLRAEALARTEAQKAAKREEKKQEDKKHEELQGKLDVAMQRLRIDAAIKRAAEGVRKLKHRMKDPQAFRLDNAVVMETGAVCYFFQGENMFGYIKPRQAVLSPDGVTFLHDEQEEFHELWKAECDAKAGEDVTGGINWVLL